MKAFITAKRKKEKKILQIHPGYKVIKALTVNIELCVTLIFVVLFLVRSNSFSLFVYFLKTFLGQHVGVKFWSVVLKNEKAWQISLLY